MTLLVSLKTIEGVSETDQALFRNRFLTFQNFSEKSSFLLFEMSLMRMKLLDQRVKSTLLSFLSDMYWMCFAEIGKNA